MHHGPSLIGDHDLMIPHVETICLRPTGIRGQCLDTGQVLGISLAEAEMPNILCDHYRGNMPNGKGTGHEVPTAWGRRVRRRQRAMIMRYLVGVGKHSAGFSEANAGLHGAICHGRSTSIGVIQEAVRTSTSLLPSQLD